MPRSARASFPDPHLKAADLPPSGATYRIVRIEWKALRPQSEWEFKPVAFFATPAGSPCSKYLILNKTTAEAITEIVGSDSYDAWTGHLVHISPAQTRQHRDTIAVSPAPADITAKYAAKPEATAAPEPAPDPARLREPVSRADYEAMIGKPFAQSNMAAEAAAQALKPAPQAAAAGRDPAILKALAHKLLAEIALPGEPELSEQQAAARDNSGA